jgi:hypothetical protein
MAGVGLIQQQSDMSDFLVQRLVAIDSHVCQCKYPSFGFGFPLARKGQTIWACGTHRLEIDRMLIGCPADQQVTERTKLL